MFFVLNVLASDVVSTSAVVASKPTRPSAVSVDCSRMPAFSSVVVGAFWLLIVGTYATRTCPSANTSATGHLFLVVAAGLVSRERESPRGVLGGFSGFGLRARIRFRIMQEVGLGRPLVGGLP